jgi:hypothetical protein
MRNNELFEAQRHIGSIPVKGISIDAIMKIIELSGELDNKFKLYNEARKKIFESYGIVIGAKGSDEMFVSHPEYKTILDTIQSLDENETEIKCTGFLELQELKMCIENSNELTVRGVEVLKTLMLKD